MSDSERVLLPCQQCGQLIEATCANPAPFCPEGCKVFARWYNKHNRNQHGIVYEGE
jgi:endogenous inhibitor of DNA gyrase (YacG/DUF329 family)